MAPRRTIAAPGTLAAPKNQRADPGNQKAILGRMGTWLCILYHVILLSRCSADCSGSNCSKTIIITTGCFTSARCIADCREVVELSDW